MKTYEIYNLTTNELLADNLEFDDVPELFGAYAEFYPDHELIVCVRNMQITTTCAKVVSKDDVHRREFYSEWFGLMDELIRMDNIH